MKEKVDLSGVTETMLVPLYSRALEAERKNPQFIDETAVKVMDSLDYDFKKKFKDSTNKMNFWGCCARTVIIDDFARDFIQKNPDEHLSYVLVGESGPDHQSGRRQPLCHRLDLVRSGRGGRTDSGLAECGEADER